NQTYKTTREPLDTEIPLIIIVDGKSASASEIVSGALQDLDRAVVIGTRSFGKGLVQRPLDLTYGTQVKVTISRYYTPSGRCIQALDYSKKDASGKAIKNDEKNYNAFKTNKGRTVYDGGGIQPDVELEATKLSAVSEALLKNDAIFNYATQYYYKNNVPENGAPSIGDKEFVEFKAFLKKENFSFDTETEKQLKKTFETAQKEKIEATIKKEYERLLTAIKRSEEVELDKNKAEVLDLILDELIKRYQYKEGLYQYYIKNNTEVKEAAQMLQKMNDYNKILRK
ncbi:MAG: S41 family peptidase, partial [Flavobacterium sp.]